MQPGGERLFPAQDNLGQHLPPPQAVTHGEMGLGALMLLLEKLSLFSSGREKEITGDQGTVSQRSSGDRGTAALPALHLDHISDPASSCTGLPAVTVALQRQVHNSGLSCPQ